MCMAVDRTGHALRYDGSTWQRPEPIDIRRQVLSVSCPSAQFCMAIDNRGYAVRYYLGTWHKPTPVLSLTHGYEATDVSCASAAFCAAVVQDGRAAVYNAGRWRETPRAVQQTGNLLNAVSCPSPGHCVAVGAGMSTYDGHWRHSLAGTHVFGDVSCIGKTCVTAARQVWMRSGGVLAATGVDAFGRAVCATRHLCLFSYSADAGSVAVDGASVGDAHVPGDAFLAGDCTKRFCMLVVPSSSYLQYEETHATR